MARTQQSGRGLAGAAGASGGTRGGTPGRIVATAAVLAGGLFLAPVLAGTAGASAHGGHHRGETHRRAHGHHHARRILTVTVAERGTLGAILVGAHGRTLYHDDLAHKDKPACTGACLKLWPPMWLAKGTTLKAGKGVSHLGVVHRSGRRQVTFEGKPLYYYAGDSRRGQANGEGLLHRWYVVHPAATTATASHHHASSSAGSTGGGSSWG